MKKIIVILFGIMLVIPYSYAEEFELVENQSIESPFRDIVNSEELIENRDIGMWKIDNNEIQSEQSQVIWSTVTEEIIPTWNNSETDTVEVNTHKNRCIHYILILLFIVTIWNTMALVYLLLSKPKTKVKKS